MVSPVSNGNIEQPAEILHHISGYTFVYRPIGRILLKI
jgi:hypothetical protein